MVTARELEIMLLIIQGYSNSRISSALTISDSTTKRHIYNLFKKLDINSRFELVTWINERAVAGVQ